MIVRESNSIRIPVQTGDPFWCAAQATSHQVFNNGPLMVFVERSATVFSRIKRYLDLATNIINLDICDCLNPLLKRKLFDGKLISSLNILSDSKVSTDFRKLNLTSSPPYFSLSSCGCQSLIVTSGTWWRLKTSDALFVNCFSAAVNSSKKNSDCNWSAMQAVADIISAAEIDWLSGRESSACWLKRSIRVRVYFNLMLRKKAVLSKFCPQCFQTNRSWNFDNDKPGIAQAVSVQRVKRDLHGKSFRLLYSWHVVFLKIHGSIDSQTWSSLKHDTPWGQ